MINNKILRYSVLTNISSFVERLDYVKLTPLGSNETFGRLRHINQSFYRSREWKNVRAFVIARDNGCDLGISEYEIHGTIFVHHMNPIDISTLIHNSEIALDAEFLITVSETTHNMIHHGVKRSVIMPVVRAPGDTKLW